MTGMLASVANLQEALCVLSAQVDIIDLKQPAQGALGALGHDEVKHIVSQIQGGCPVSATIGDLPMQSDVIFQAVIRMAVTGVDYIKIGFFPGGDWQDTIDILSGLTCRHRLIAVLFADTNPDLSIVPSLEQAGFTGVMLDTMDKKQGSLTHVFHLEKISQFVTLAKQHNLLCGLAGSLKLADIPLLLPYAPDYLGFRGALCDQQQRTAALNTSAINRIQQEMVLKPVCDL